MVEAPGTAPGSMQPIPYGVYHYSRMTDTLIYAFSTNIESLWLVQTRGIVRHRISLLARVSKPDNVLANVGAM